MEHNRIVYEKPYDSEVEYLRSTGTQWIDTGIIPDSEHKYEVTVSKTADNTAEVVPLGSWNAWQNAMFGSDIKNSTVGIYILWGGGSYQTNIITNDWITLYGERGLSKATLISTGEVLASRNFVGNFTCNQSAYLFALNRNGSVVYRGSCKISRAKIWNGDTLVRDFIPVRVGSVGYMYDKVSKKLFANKGTGNFILGSDVANPVPNIRRVFRFGNKRFVIPMPYDSKIEYLESPSGNAYINTLIPANEISEFTVRIAPITVPSTFYALGADASGNTRFSVGYSTANNGRIQVRLGEYYNTIDYTLGQFDTITLNRLTGKYYVNGTEYTGKIVTNSKTNPNSFILFRARTDNSLYSQRNTTRIASFSAKGLNGELVLDFIPVRRGNVGYLYDKVSGKLFANAGTGQFILGNDIND